GLRRPAVRGPHAAAPAPQEGRTAAPAARGARHPAASRPAATLREERARSVSRLAGAAAVHGQAPAPGHVLVCVRGGHVAVASARALPARAAKSRLACRRARDLPRDGAALLAARGAAVAEPGALAELDHPRLPAARCRAGHDLIGAAGILRAP